MAVHVGDDLRVTLTVKDEDGNPVDCSDPAADLKILFRRPDGTTVSETASLATDGTDGQITVRKVNLVDQPGVWRVQARITLTGAGPWHSAEQQFTVQPNIA